MSPLSLSKRAAAAVRVSYGDRLAVRATFTDGSTWGAMDRSGAALVDPIHSSRNAVINELESLMADTRPML